ALEKIVEADDPRPVRIFSARGLTVHRRNRSLQREPTGLATKSIRDQRQGLGNLLLIPAAAILLFKNDEIASLVHTGIAPCVLKQHEGEESCCFGRRPRQQGPDQAPQTDGLSAEIGPDQRPAS